MEFFSLAFVTLENGNMSIQKHLEAIVTTYMKAFINAQSNLHQAHRMWASILYITALENDLYGI